MGVRKSQSIPVGMVSRGDLKNVKPISDLFGFDRDGGPVDRFYIERFLSESAAAIRGRVLEIGDNEYTLRFGKEKVVQSDILHVDDSNPKANFVGSLTDLPQIPDNSFDCIVLTQTLHLIYDFHQAIDTCHRILKPGGVMLFTSPGITPIDHGEWMDTWLWSFTQASVRRIMERSFLKGNVAIESWGNVAVATAFLYGLGLGDISKEELLYQDPHYPVIITAKCVKE